MSEEIQYPDTLVRFFGNIQFALNCIETGYIAIPRCTEFNDPFDPPLYVHTDNASIFDSSRLEEAEKDVRQHIKEKVFIGCFSEVDLINYPEDSMHMWAHYSNGHRGVAIEFNTDSLLDSFPNDNIRGEPAKIILKKIDYKEPDFLTNEELNSWRENGDVSALEKNLEKALYCKKDNFNQEKEWRIITYNEETDLNIISFKLRENTINAVYIGFQCSEENSIKIKKQVQRHHKNAEIFKMHKKRGLLQLEAKQF